MNQAVGGRSAEYRYTPKMNESYWQVIRAFVLDVVDEVQDDMPYPRGALTRAVAELVLWAWRSEALPLSRDVIFTRSFINHYVLVGCPQLVRAARGNRRSLLFGVAELLRNDLGYRMPPLPKSDPTAPYRPDEILGLLSWARGQSTRDRRDNAHTLIALGLGAGLSAQEIIDLRGSDIHRVPDGIDISVPAPRQRLVPVLHDWAPLLEARTWSANGYAFRAGRTISYPNAISNFVARSHGPGVRPQTQRMRSTWLIRQLEAGVRSDVLIHAAGVESLEALTRYLRFMNDMPPSEALQLLRQTNSGS